eukprot:g28684.t1
MSPARDVMTFVKKKKEANVSKEKAPVEDNLREENIEFLSQVAIKKEEVMCILKSIKVDKSLGPDGISSRMWKEAREQIAGALTDNFVSLLATDDVPEDCRMANVVPLFKKESRDNPANYRP